jgi:salicylate hydroxylase
VLIAAEVVTEVRLPGTAQRRRAGLHRAELLQVLFDAVSKNPNIKMHTNKHISRLTTLSDDEMQMEFQDSSTAIANLVVGADGIHSVVRGTYLKDEAIFSGIVAYRGLVPMEKVVEFWGFDDSDVSGFFTQQGKHFMTCFLKRT